MDDQIEVKAVVGFPNSIGPLHGPSRLSPRAEHVFVHSSVRFVNQSIDVPVCDARGS